MTLDWVHIAVTASNQGTRFTSMVVRLLLSMDLKTPGTRLNWEEIEMQIIMVILA